VEEYITHSDARRWTLELSAIMSARKDSQFELCVVVIILWAFQARNGSADLFSRNFEIVVTARAKTREKIVCQSIP
jgi:hypothetical protein